MVALLRRILHRIQHEPVILIGGAMVALGAAQDAINTGLSPDDVALAVAQALVLWGIRELVRPTIAVREDGS